MKFQKPWRTLSGPDDIKKRLPILDVYLRLATGAYVREMFIVDSGADISMGPRKLCELVGLQWESGEMIEIGGIAQREECVVPCTLHDLKVYIRETGSELTVPFCFAEGDAPLILGREGFFDAFRIDFDKKNQITTFESLE
jgi:hypothetical protein